MNVCGIVCEYNPFHNGHAYQITEIRRRLGEDAAIVCVMSGDFVQRGEAAVFAKHDRACAAVHGGADLVLELPLPWSVSSAEGFARGALGLLGATGIISHLAFGSESGALAELEQTAEQLLRPEMDTLIRENLEIGISYAAARQKAVEFLTGAPAPCLENPNDILAVEYLKAVRLLSLQVTPIAVQRRGTGHDSTEENEFPSASLLREKLRTGKALDSWMPAPAWAALERGAGLVDADALETAILSRLRGLPENAFENAPDAGEGLYRRVWRAAYNEPTLEAVLDAACSRRYPRARLRRILLCAALGVQKGDNKGIPPYLRVLAANVTGLKLLREMEDSASLPVITKPAKVHGMSTEVQGVFLLGAAAADLYSLGFRRREDRCGGRDWRTSPVIVK